MSGLQIENAIDLHCHFGPDTFGSPHTFLGLHCVTAIQAAQEAAASGHAAIVLKTHGFASVNLAHAVAEVVPEIRVFGGICTDYPTGGLNVEAVEAALAMDAKIVWLPTLHSHADFLNFGGFESPIIDYKDTGIVILDDNGKLLPAVHEIFELVRAKNAILATGHTSLEEHFAVVKEFARRGNVLVTHATENCGPKLNHPQCVELADMGATIELCAQQCRNLGYGTPGKDPAQVVPLIQDVGAHRCTLATDYGGLSYDATGAPIPHPAPGLQEFLDLLWAAGISDSDLQMMGSTNPARLVGVDVPLTSHSTPKERAERGGRRLHTDGAGV